MKILAAFATALLVASQAAAQYQPTDKPAGTAATVVKPADKPGAKKDLANKPAPEPVLHGTVITRADGTYLTLEAADGDFRLSFYNKKKMPVSPDVARATARWPNRRGPGDVRAVLNVSGNALVGGNKRVDPPYTYTVYLTLLNGEGEDSKVVESFVVPFRG